MKDAVLSTDQRYRYTLTRRWAWTIAGRMATFVMLNPSTADSTRDDPTIRRCIGFADRWGCDGLHVVNLYAYRATDPRELWRVEDAVGPANDDWISLRAMRAHAYEWPLVAAWGANARPDRVAHVLVLPGMQSLTALALTKGGAPRHPLYVRADVTPAPLVNGGVAA